ncbi:MAG: helix-turn-helix transcriptional regulator [Kiritimatiellae bacterium]|nr:helix-turn-helix transcriptional regulator [Kiritimatiellia bacterium]
MKQARYEAMVRKALAHMEGNLGKPLTVPEIARAVGYSDVHLRRAFRAVTGSGVLPNLLRLRMDRARQLLRETQLDISEVGARVGFRGASWFSRAFVAKVGMTPSAFRDAARATGEAPVPAAEAVGAVPGRVWFRDDFSSRAVEPWWRRLSGRWRQTKGQLAGSHEEDGLMALAKPLPENFRVSFEAKVEPAGRARPAHLLVHLRDDQLEEYYCGIALGAHDNTCGEFRYRGVARQWNPRARVRPGQWQRVVLELETDTTRLILDGEEAFGFRDPFPPSYTARSKLVLGCWRGAIRVRAMMIEDLGAPTLVHAVSVGDSLYNAGLHEKAREFYTRRMQATDSAAEMVELRYKIGMCYLAQDAFSPARQWLDKVGPQQESPFWSQQAELAKLAADWRMGKHEAFMRHARQLFAEPAVRDGVRETVARACGDAETRGFWARSAALAKMLCGLETEDRLLAALAELRASGSSFYANRLPAAERHARRVLARKDIPESLRIKTLLLLSAIATARGRNEESDTILEQVKSATDDPVLHAQCEVRHAWNLRARRQFEEALDRFKAAAIKYSALYDAGAWAATHAAFILCEAGDTKPARRIHKQILRTHPNTRTTRPGNRSGFLYVPHLIDGEYEQAAALLEEDARHDDEPPALRAAQGIMAGILYAVASREDRAKELWMEVRRRFPPSRCHFYADVAEALQAGKSRALEELPYQPGHRAELFYLAALLHEARQEPGRARRWLNLCVAEDPTLHWPARLAAKRLELLQG